MNFTDLRIIKTQERLQNALLGLLGTKELKAITVKEICEKAGKPQCILSALRL